VTATDGDKDREQNIVYFLTGQGIDPDNPANSKFDINRTIGFIDYQVAQPSCPADCALLTGRAISFYFTFFAIE
jgi:hypothetical protein